jgi:hypothetical protein
MTELTPVIGYPLKLWIWGFCFLGRWFCIAAARNFQVSGYFSTLVGEIWGTQIVKYRFETLEHSFLITIW